MRSDPARHNGRPEVEGPDLDRTFARFRAALCGATLVMVALSWPLWLDEPDFPRVPFVASLPGLPGPASWGLLGAIVATLGLATLGRWTRPMIGSGLLLFAWATLRDQGRFQPWAYQFAVIGLGMACRSKAGALRCARWYVIGLYFYSGLSKLDASFCRELGPTFLSAGRGPLGFEPSSWPASARTLACLGMPAFEVAVAALLLGPATRRIGLVGAVVQHLSLLWVLGPRGLGHSPIVLAWNVALIVEDLILFGRPPIVAGPGGESRLGRLAGPAFGLAMILPAVERLGLCDAWPGHALYASHAERSEVFVHEDDLDRYPDPVRRHLAPPGVTPWRRLDLTAWSREARGTPPYPSGRVGNAVAEFLEARHAGQHPVRLVQWGRARAWDGARDRDESLGLKAIRLRGDLFRLNAHPAESARRLRPGR